VKSLAVIGGLLGGCVGADDSTLHVEISGAGHGWVKSLTTDEVCTQSCELPVIWRDGGTPIRVGSAERISSSSTALDSLHQAGVPSGRELAVRFDRDPNADLMVFPQTNVGAFVLADNGDVIYAADVGLHRIAADGWPLWTSPVEVGGLLAVAPSGRILAGARVSAFDADGSMAWQSSIVASAIAALPDGGAVALVGITVHALAASDGRAVWSTSVPGATALTASRDGVIAVAAGTKIVRRSATGAPLPDLDLPVAISKLAYDPNGLLIAQSAAPFPGSTLPMQQIRTLVFAPDGTVASDTSGLSFVHHDIAAMENRIFTWSEEMMDFHGSPFTLGNRLEAWTHTGILAWSLAKPITGNPLPHEITAVDRAIPQRVACNRTQCAAAGFYEGAPPEQTRWIEVVSPL
jgi:outer membrane protein assembly factor BamB